MIHCAPNELIKSLFDDIWISNYLSGFFKGRGSKVVNLNSQSHETRNLGPQRITVKSSEVAQPTLLPESSIIDVIYV